MLVSIYRVEAPRGGYGPYNKEHGELLEPMFEKHRSGSHPSPRQDWILRGIQATEHCGFATREQLHEWFEGFEDLLHEAGFVLAKYVVPVFLVRYGATQAVFRRGDYFPVEETALR